MKKMMMASLFSVAAVGFSVAPAYAQSSFNFSFSHDADQTAKTTQTIKIDGQDVALQCISGSSCVQPATIAQVCTKSVCSSDQIAQLIPQYSYVVQDGEQSILQGNLSQLIRNLASRVAGQAVTVSVADAHHVYSQTQFAYTTASSMEAHLSNAVSYAVSGGMNSNHELNRKIVFKTDKVQIELKLTAQNIKEWNSLVQKGHVTGLVS